MAASRPADEDGFVAVDQVAGVAVQLAGVDGVTVAVMGSTPDVRELLYTTDELGRSLDELQFLLGEGPGVSAHLDGAPHDAVDLSDPEVCERWPLYGPDAACAGARALFALPLLGGEQSLGVLTLYRRTAGPLSDSERRAAGSCADAIVRSVLSHYETSPPAADDCDRDGDWDDDRDDGDVAATAADLDRAVLEGAGPYNLAEVHIASGMVAVQLGVSAGVALGRLRGYAYADGRSVVDVAADVVARRLELGRD